MDLNKLMIDDGDPYYYDPVMRNVFEDHMEYLRTSPATETRSVPEVLAYQNQNNLQGLFNAMRIAPELHFIVMRMNKFTSFTSNLEEDHLLLIPNADEVGHIVQSHRATNRIN
jgi:hypothetical protein